MTTPQETGQLSGAVSGDRASGRVMGEALRVRIVNCRQTTNNNNKGLQLGSQ